MTDTAWLFPGALAGRHLSAEPLARRLNKVGIYARPARTNTMIGLASEVPAAVLADLLGLNPKTAVRWVNAASGDWTGYAAHRARTGTASSDTSRAPE